LNSKNIKQINNQISSVDRNKNSRNFTKSNEVLSRIQVGGLHEAEEQLDVIAVNGSFSSSIQKELTDQEINPINIKNSIKLDSSPDIHHISNMKWSNNKIESSPNIHTLDGYEQKRKSPSAMEKYLSDAKI